MNNIIDFIDNHNIDWDLKPEKLVQISLDMGMGKLSNNHVLSIDTGKFTGRSPKDRFIVDDIITHDNIDWGNINQPISQQNYQKLKKGLIEHLNDKNLFGRRCYACSQKDYKLNITLITEYPWSNLFGYNMFLRPNKEEHAAFSHEWTIICAPSFKVSKPEQYGLNQDNFAILNFNEKVIIIGGTGYTGEIKKGIFSALNFILPHDKNVLSMHCSANVGKDGDTAIFFGLSGTGKTTLSSDENRRLIGDDEHGWSDDSIFNFEGGCYAKTIDLSSEKEPQIYSAIKYGAILENVGFYENSSTPDYEDSSITENTRVSYPIHHIDNIMIPSAASGPKNIFFLTADAFGVLPPISKLTTDQAMYHFMSGYTAKVAGTEVGITEPTTTFSAGFGAAFLPLHPVAYAELLGEKLRASDVNVWLVNTGWTGGSYGVGSRMKLSYTRAMITAALNGELDNVSFKTLPIFELSYPTTCPNVPSELLNPRDTWSDKTKYDDTATDLASQFVKNFEQYVSEASKEVLAAAPKVLV